MIWSDVGRDSRWFRFNTSNGNAPTGAKGHGYLSFIAYPGEYVHYVPPASTGGGIHGISDNNSTVSSLIAISGLHIESAASSSSDGAPINLQAGSDHWRVVNNESVPGLPPTAPKTRPAAWWATARTSPRSAITSTTSAAAP